MCPRAREDGKAKRFERGAYRTRIVRVTHEDRGLTLGGVAFERGFERINDGNRRRPRRLAVLCELARLSRVEVKARNCGPLHAFPRTLARSEHRDAGRSRKRLLRCGNEDVVTPIVHPELRRTETADRIDQRYCPVRAQRGG